MSKSTTKKEYETHNVIIRREFGGCRAHDLAVSLVKSRTRAHLGSNMRCHVYCLERCMPINLLGLRVWGLEFQIQGLGFKGFGIVFAI